MTKRFFKVPLTEYLMSLNVKFAIIYRAVLMVYKLKGKTLYTFWSSLFKCTLCFYAMWYCYIIQIHVFDEMVIVLLRYAILCYSARA